MEKNSIIRLLIADDHQIFRDGIRSLLDKEPGISLEGVAPDGQSLMTMIPEVQPDVILLDISMPGISGVELIPGIREMRKKLKVLILSMHTDDEYVYAAIQAGADGFLAKQNTSRDELCKAIYSVYNGEEYFSSSVVSVMKKNYLKAVSRNSSDNPITANPLTKREQEILNLVVEGFPNAEIAEKLTITIRTVETHKSNILQKLNLRNSVELVKYAIRNNMVGL